jgi:hypothetical protein
MRRYVVLLAVVALLVAALAVPAFAQGQVERGPQHAKSICSYSGLNDHDPEEPPGGRTQSYGQDVRSGGIEPSAVKSGAPSPGTFCNPQKSPFVGPFE